MRRLLSLLLALLLTASSAAAQTVTISPAQWSLLAGYLDGVEGLLTTQNGHVDGIEGLLATTNSTLTTIDGRVDGLETLLGTTNTSLSTIAGHLAEINDGLLDFDSGAGTVNRVAYGLLLPGSGGPVIGGTSSNPIQVGDAGGTLSIDDGGASITVDGSISCSNCSGSGASLVDDALFTIATDSVAPAGFLADQNSPDSVNEGDVGLARMTLARIQLQTIWDAAGNERGANVNASNQLLTLDGNSAAMAASLAALDDAVSGSGFNITQFAGAAVPMTTTQADNLALSLDGLNVTAFMYMHDGTNYDMVRGNTTDGLLVNLGSNNDVTVTGEVDITPASPTAGAYLPVRLTDGSNYFGQDTQAIHGTALGTITNLTGGLLMGWASGSAPTDPGADGDAIVAWFDRSGRLAVHDGGGTITVDGTVTVTDGSGALNVICDSGCGSGTVYDHGEAITLASANGVISGGRVSAAAPSTTGVIDDDFAAQWMLSTGASVTQPSFAGVLAVAGNGASGTGVQRVTLANDSTGVLATVSTVTSLTQFNGNAINLGAGTTGTGTLRMTIATDDPVNDALVKLDAQMVADGAATAGNPAYIGGLSTSSIVGQTPVSTAQRVGFVGGLDRVQIVREHANLEDRVSGVAAVTDGSSTSLVAAQGSGIRFCATTVIVSNSSATNVTVDLRDGTGGAVIATIPAAANMGGAVIPLQVPLCTSANTALAVDPSASASTVTTTAIGFKTEL